MKHQKNSTLKEKKPLEYVREETYTTALILVSMLFRLSLLNLRISTEESRMASLTYACSFLVILRPIDATAVCVCVMSFSLTVQNKKARTCETLKRPQRERDLPEKSVSCVCEEEESMEPSSTLQGMHTNSSPFFLFLESSHIVGRHEMGGTM